MKISKKIVISSVAGIVSYVPAFLAFAGTPKDFKQLINDNIISGIVAPILPLLVGLAVVVFVYGVLTTMLSEGGEKKEEGKQFMLWGIIGIFVMVSVWGLVNVLKETFGLTTTAPSIHIEPINTN